MTNSLALGPDGQANHVLQVYRDGKNSGALASDVHFLPGFDLHADPALGLGGRFTSPAGRLLEFEADMTAPGGWVGLHVALPAQDLSQVGIAGFGARIAAPGVHVVRACLRSGKEDGFVDCFFDKHLLFRPEEASHIDALSVAHRDNLPQYAPWRELILFLPTEPFRLSLIDLRLFVV